MKMEKNNNFKECNACLNSEVSVPLDSYKIGPQSAC